MKAISIENFSNIDFEDQFFDTLKQDYIGFDQWFAGKALQGDEAYVLKDDRGGLQAFLYTKLEDALDGNIQPLLPKNKRLKIGTFKVDPHGTRLGERFLKLAIDRALREEVDELYVTVFEKHDKLIALFQTFGFSEHGIKSTKSGEELVLVKKLFLSGDDSIKRYPIMKVGDNRVFVVGIKPEYHTRLFPDSKLNNENADEYISDVSHTNGIFKNYIGAMRGLPTLSKGDIVVIYRTKDESAGNAYYSSVLTSFCTVLAVKRASEFSTFDEFYKYCKPYSVLSQEELQEYYVAHNSTVITMVYNAAFKRRLTNKFIQERIGKPDYWGFFGLDKDGLDIIIDASGVDPRLFSAR